MAQFCIKEPVPPSQLQSRRFLPGLEAVIGKALEKDRNLRYQSAADMRTDLQRLKRDGERAACGKTPTQAANGGPLEWGTQRHHAPGNEVEPHIFQHPGNVGHPSGIATPAKKSWPVIWRLVSIAAIVIAISVATYVVVRGRVTNHRETAPPSSSATLHQRKSVAVLGFQNVSGHADVAWYSTAFSEMLRTELAAGDQLRIVEGETVDRMKSDLHLPESDSLAGDTLKRVQKMVGADYVVVGSFTELGKEAGGQIRLDLRVQDTRSGETLAAVAETGTVEKMFDLVSRAGASVRPKLGLPPVATEDAGAVRAMLPGNPEAARFYSQALAKLRVFDAIASRSLLQKSIAAEPYFAPAHSALAAAWKMLGYEKDAKDEAQKAFKLASNLPREEQLSIEARYRELSHQWDEAIRLY